MINLKKVAKAVKLVNKLCSKQKKLIESVEDIKEALKEARVRLQSLLQEEISEGVTVRGSAHLNTNKSIKALTIDILAANKEGINTCKIAEQLRALGVTKSDNIKAYLFKILNSDERVIKIKWGMYALKDGVELNNPTQEADSDERYTEDRGFITESKVLPADLSRSQLQRLLKKRSPSF